MKCKQCGKETIFDFFQCPQCGSDGMGTKISAPANSPILAESSPQEGNVSQDVVTLPQKAGPWEYKAVPFMASFTTEADRAQAAASQFERLLTEMNEMGFEYLRMDHYSLMEPPGCLGALFGAKVMVIPYDVAIFRRTHK